MLKFVFRFCLVALILSSLQSAAYSLDLNKVKSSMLSGDYKQAITEGEKILATQAEDRDLVELYYLLGLSYLKDGNYLRASDIFEIILKEFARSKFEDDAKLGLGDTYFLSGNLDKAEKTYEDLIKNDPATKLKAAIYHRLSQIGFKNGDTAQGNMYLDKLKQEFPSGIELALNRDLYAAVASSSPGIYSVQVGAFSTKENAVNLVQKLTQAGYRAYIEEGTSMGKESYRVRVGKFPSRQEALLNEQKLAAEGYPTKILP